MAPAGYLGASPCTSLGAYLGTFLDTSLAPAWVPPVYQGVSLALLWAPSGYLLGTLAPPCCLTGACLGSSLVPDGVPPWVPRRCLLGACVPPVVPQEASLGPPLSRGASLGTFRVFIWEGEI